MKTTKKTNSDIQEAIYALIYEGLICLNDKELASVKEHISSPAFKQVKKNSNLRAAKLYFLWHIYLNKDLKDLQKCLFSNEEF